MSKDEKKCRCGRDLPTGKNAYVKNYFKSYDYDDWIVKTCDLACSDQMKDSSPDEIHMYKREIVLVDKDVVLAHQDLT